MKTKKFNNKYMIYLMFQEKLDTIMLKNQVNLIQCKIDLFI